ncbi:MAG: DMT family transporter [Candidatus Tectomicrobia bacterium]|uniref:DMT family transporter n=1 Tax=Tectimicrobiota bacterium TaxID=2528274 RepID=A0A933GMU1_UNCTE|nr:DMT family transporter [Candidatus Tectomicrobia bacterium]
MSLAAEKSLPQDYRLEAWVIFSLIGINFIWGISFVAIKILGRYAPPITGTGLRFGIAALALIIEAYFLKARIFRLPERYGVLLIMGLMMALLNVLCYTGSLFTTAGRTALFFNTQPFFLLFLAHFFLPGDHLTLRKLSGITIALFGVTALFFDKLSANGTSTYLGDFLVMGSAVVWACQNLLVRKLSLETGAITILFWQCAIAAIVLLPLGHFLETGRQVQFTTQFWVAILYLSLIAAGFSFVFYTYLMQRKSIVRLNSFVFLSPVFGVIDGWLILGEPLGVKQALGTALIGLGIYIVNRK